MLDEGVGKNNMFSYDEAPFCSSRLRKSNTPFITPWKQGVQLEIDTRHFAASLTSHDFINEPLAPLEPSPFPALASRLLPFIVLPCLPVPGLCPPVSGETRHFSWDAILIAVLRLKRLLRSAITLRRRTHSPYIPLAFRILGYSSLKFPGRGN